LYFAPDYQFDNTRMMNGGAPFCFPICGRLMNAEYQDRCYAMNIHGFAYQQPWEILTQNKNSVSLSLAYTDVTLREYPFKFKIILHYEVQDNLLLCRQLYENTGSAPMPYYAGFHPYLRLPLNYQPLTRLLYNDALTDIIGETPPFKTPTHLLLPELNESLVKLGEDKLIYLNSPDGSILEVETEGVNDKDLFPYVQLYHRLDEPFLCIEPWMSFPNAMNHKTGVRWLAPGQKDTGIFYLRLKF
jgi:galactose mutarotase-like enzyme